MTDEQEAAWWDACENGSRLLVHLLMMLLTWPLWLLGRLASADTHPEGGDAHAAPFMSGAVPKADAQTTSPITPNGA